MQNVACPTTTVNKPKPIPNGSSRVRNAEFSAIPVTIPGKAIGSTTSKEIVSLPKNL